MIKESTKRTVFFYANVSSTHRPCNIIPSVDFITYDFVYGDIARNWPEVAASANTFLWNGKPIEKMHPALYYDYCFEKAKKVVPEFAPRIKSILKAVLRTDLTPVRICHGDLTLSNCLITHNGVVFIDPGDPRGLPCRELDEAKILQSLDGWHEVLHGLVTPQYPKMATRRIHWVLLLSHYIRLLAHKHPPRALVFAKQRVKELVELL